MNKRIITIISGILSLLLTLSLFLTFIFISIGANINSKSLNKNIVSSGYSSGISNKILSQLYDYADTNHLPHEIFDEFVNTTFMSSDVYEYMISISTNSKNDKYLIDINKKKAALTQKIKDYALNNMNLTNQQKANIDQDVNNFVDECMEVYKNNIKSNVLEKMSKYIAFIDKYFVLLSVLLIFIDLFIIFILVLIQKWKHRGYRYSLYSFIACELIFLVLTGYILISNIINRFTIISKELYKLATTILSGCLLGFYVSILILALLIIIDSYLYIKNKDHVI